MNINYSQKIVVNYLFNVTNTSHANSSTLISRFMPFTNANYIISRLSQEISLVPFKERIKFDP